MHETGLVRDLVHRIEALARAEGAKSVVGVEVWIGAHSHLSDAHFRDHFEEETEGTIAQGAQLAIEVSEDFGHTDAQSLVLRAVELEF